MSALSPVERRERRRRRRRQESIRWGIRLLLALLIFVLGVALGQALHDNPRPGGTRTVDHPVTLTVEPETVTVTTTVR